MNKFQRACYRAAKPQVSHLNSIQSEIDYPAYKLGRTTYAFVNSERDWDIVKMHNYVSWCRSKSMPIVQEAYYESKKLTKEEIEQNNQSNRERIANIKSQRRLE